MFCKHCGKEVVDTAVVCVHCGSAINAGGQIGSKSKTAAGLLGILVGSFGAHKFYLGQTGLGILYLLFFWTGIPGIAGLIEGIIYLTMSDQEFFQKYG